MALIYVFGLFVAFQPFRLSPDPPDRRCVCPRSGPCAWHRRCETILINIPIGSARILSKRFAHSGLCKNAGRFVSLTVSALPHIRSRRPEFLRCQSGDYLFYLGTRSNFQRMGLSAAAKRPMPATQEVRTARLLIAASLEICLSFPIHGGKNLYARNSQQKHR